MISELNKTVVVLTYPSNMCYGFDGVTDEEWECYMENMDQVLQKAGMFYVGESMPRTDCSMFIWATETEAVYPISPRLGECCYSIRTDYYDQWENIDDPSDLIADISDEFYEKVMYNYDFVDEDFDFDGAVELTRMIIAKAEQAEVLNVNEGVEKGD